MQAARTENLRLPVGADGREICLRFSSKGECNRSCKRSHAPLRRHTRELLIRFIRGSREVMNKNKRKFDGVGEQESHGDTGTGVVIGTRRIIMAQDLVADVAAAETEITAGAAVGEGGMVQT